jgi:hypothetical protein
MGEPVGARSNASESKRPVAESARMASRTKSRGTVCNLGTPINCSSVGYRYNPRLTRTNLPARYLRCSQALAAPRLRFKQR